MERIHRLSDGGSKGSVHLSGRPSLGQGRIADSIRFVKRSLKKGYPIFVFFVDPPRFVTGRFVDFPPIIIQKLMGPPSWADVKIGQPDGKKALLCGVRGNIESTRPFIFDDSDIVSTYVVSAQIISRDWTVRHFLLRCFQSFRSSCATSATAAHSSRVSQTEPADRVPTFSLFATVE